jgi:hypothetical protein
MFSGGERRHYISESKKFINQILSEHYQNESILLKSQPSAMDRDCIDPLFIDTTIVGKEDHETIVAQLSYPLIKKWDKKLINDIKIISQDTTTAIFRDTNKGWNYFHKHYGEGYYSFSVPVFFKNYNFCLFYSRYYCGGLCSSGQAILFQKEKGQWKVLKISCQLIS